MRHRFWPLPTPRSCTALGRTGGLGHPGWRRVQLKRLAGWKEIMDATKAPLVGFVLNGQNPGRGRGYYGSYGGYGSYGRYGYGYGYGYGY